MDSIIVVDLQKAFPVPPDLDRRIKERSGEFPLRVFTKFLNEPDSLFCRKSSSCLPGTAERELLIDPSPGGLVLDKRGYGHTAEQIDQLRGAEVQKALICGLDTDVCGTG